MTYQDPKQVKDSRKLYGGKIQQIKDYNEQSKADLDRELRRIQQNATENEQYLSRQLRAHRG